MSFEDRLRSTLDEQLDDIHRRSPNSPQAVEAGIGRAVSRGTTGVEPRPSRQRVLAGIAAAVILVCLGAAVALSSSDRTEQEVATTADRSAAQPASQPEPTIEDDATAADVPTHDPAGNPARAANPSPAPGLQPATAESNVPPRNALIYVIESGDTLGHVAHQFDVSVETILRSNVGLDPNVLHVGQEIIIDRNASPAPPVRLVPTPVSTPAPPVNAVAVPYDPVLSTLRVAAYEPFDQDGGEGVGPWFFSEDAVEGQAGLDCFFAQLDVLVDVASIRGGTSGAYPATLIEDERRAARQALANCVEPDFYRAKWIESHVWGWNTYGKAAAEPDLLPDDPCFAPVFESPAEFVAAIVEVARFDRVPGDIGPFKNCVDI